MVTQAIPIFELKWLHRTHRERKELYIKALELEVLRLKETFSSVSQDKERLAAENEQLKALLAQHGIAWKGTGGVDEYRAQNSTTYASNSSRSGSDFPLSARFSSPRKLETHSSTSTPGFPPSVARADSTQRTTDVDWDQAGIDFVLTYSPPHIAQLSPPLS